MDRRSRRTLHSDRGVKVEGKLVCVGLGVSTSSGVGVANRREGLRLKVFIEYTSSSPPRTRTETTNDSLEPVS